MNPFISFCVYVAARVFVQYLKFRPDDTAARASLQFVFVVLDALKNQNPLTESFLCQLEVDIEGTPFQDIRLPSTGQQARRSFLAGNTYGEVMHIFLLTTVHLAKLMATQTAPNTGTLHRSLLSGKGCSGGNAQSWDPSSKPDNRANLPACLPARPRPQPSRQPTSTSASTVPHLSSFSNLPGFSKATFNPNENTTGTGVLFDIEPPSRFHDVTNSAQESSTPSTMNSSNTSFMRTDNSSSPKRSKPSSQPQDTSVQDSATATATGGFDATSLNQFIESSNQNSSTNHNPLFSMGSIHSSAAAERPQQNMPSTWDFPINVTGDPNDPNAEAIDLMTTDLDGFNGAQWAHIMGSGGWNP